MKEKKSFFIPTLYLLALFSISVVFYLSKKSYDNMKENVPFENITYVSNNILNRTIPIINISEEIIKPYNDTNVSIFRFFYNSDDTIEQKEKSIVFFGDTYMSNTGIDYKSDNAFDVISVYDGTVIDILEDELLGKTVKIRHNGELISVYQGINNIEVLKGDVVVKGQKIGTSGTNKINIDINNILHFEIYKNGETIDPLKCFDKKLGDI